MLANRLTENPKWNVLLIEVGDVETPLQSVPVAAPYSVFTKYNWGYNAEPQANACLGKSIVSAKFNFTQASSQVAPITDAVTHAAKLLAAQA